MKTLSHRQEHKFKARKDPKKLARHTKRHDDKHQVDRHEIIECDTCGNEALSCICYKEN